LVLNRVNISLSSPVLGGRKVGIVKKNFPPGVLGLDPGSGVSLALIMSHGGEEVVLKLERVLLGVDLVDVMILLGEEVESVLKLLSGSNEETLLFDVVHEFLF